MNHKLHALNRDALYKYLFIFQILKFQVNYPPHAHDAEEWYFVLSGNPKWFVDGEKFTAKPGDFIHHPPRATHSMVNFQKKSNFNIFKFFCPNLF